MDTYQEFIFYRTYSRWLPEVGRREVWEETVSRYLGYIFSKVINADQIPDKVRRKAEQYILSLEVMPSMRALWAAGENADKDNAVFYNCSAVATDSLEAFGEALYLLACGCGVGYSVERRYVSKLPSIHKQQDAEPLYFKIPDSREGWKQAVDFGIRAWYNGRDVNFDYSQIRPAGARLKTSGGYASGPEPLRRCLEYMRNVIVDAQGRRLTSLEVSDIMNEIASSIVVGGVRRSSEIALTDLDDMQMKTSKHGEFHQRRFKANISAAFHKKPDVLSFAQEFIDMARSKSGERGIFNVFAARKRAPKRRSKSELSLTNPCAEIVLRNMEFCNLTEVIVRPHDDEDSVRDKITTAVWLGALQSCFTYFPNIRDKWRENCEEERLLGVSLSGLCDNKKLVSPEVLRMWKRHAVKTAKQVAAILDINVPAAVTCCKPSGTVSQLVSCASGVHPRWSQYYVRRVRISAHDPLLQMLRDQGMPTRPDGDNEDTWILEFPIKSPDGSIYRHDMTALEQLEWYKVLMENWAEHNVSCSIYVMEEEWLDVTKWVYDNFELVNGVAFFPKDDAAYQDAPYEDLTEEQYEKMVQAMPNISFDQLSNYEGGVDNTEGEYAYACQGGSCEL
jgi:ribonucleoside-triphosphate reductase (thioredoxin)